MRTVTGRCQRTVAGVFEECQKAAALPADTGRGLFNGAMQPGLVVVVEDDPAIADVQRRYLAAAF